MSKPEQPFCVWFICAEAEALLDIPTAHQHWQDMMVVRATCEEQALAVASGLLKARTAAPATITRVMSESALTDALTTLRRVKQGELRPASLRDRDLEAWRVRFLE